MPLINVAGEQLNNPLYEVYGGSFIGGGAAELMINRFANFQSSQGITNATGETESQSDESSEGNDKFSSDLEIAFGDQSDPMAFARRAYIISEIPASEYVYIHQLLDDASLILVYRNKAGTLDVAVFAYGSFPENKMEQMVVTIEGKVLQGIGISSDRQHIYFTYSGKTKLVENTAQDFMSSFISDVEEYKKKIVDTTSWAINVWPKLEYQQLYSDAWRMLRDFYYDPLMGYVDWDKVHDKYLPLLSRCGRREELDDILKQMASELSALHVFVYGGEYNIPLHGNLEVAEANEIASLGAVLKRSVEWSGYVIKEIPEIDPDFNQIDSQMIYSPLSETTLRMSGQSGLLPGDVIVGVNGESVLAVPDINMLLRGMSGRSIRLDVLRIKSQPSFNDIEDTTGPYLPEPLIVVPLSLIRAEELRYAAWEWKTRNKAKTLAKEKGFSVGYMHLRSMSGSEGEDAFVRGFYPDFDKQGLIVDVRHNNGGNIDSWLLDVLQRKAWMYWQGRATNITTGGLGWDEQYAFRGHVVVLIDEKTSSDGEGFARGMSELGLGKLVGSRTWGGGIWLASDNKLVDGGIATAPEFGIYNANFGWGLGIEQMGVKPDFFVDNNPRETFDGRDEQLERAIEILKDWLLDEPIIMPKSPGPHTNMSLKKEAEGCPA